MKYVNPIKVIFSLISVAKECFAPKLTWEKLCELNNFIAGVLRGVHACRIFFFPWIL